MLLSTVTLYHIIIIVFIFIFIFIKRVPKRFFIRSNALTHFATSPLPAYNFSVFFENEYEYRMAFDIVTLF